MIEPVRTRVQRARQDGHHNSKRAPLRVGDTPLIKIIHQVCCPYCQHTFDLFAAPWCDHVDGGHPSKRCVPCHRCLCAHPAYQEPHFWTEAPPVFRQRGFDRLFAFYL